MTTYAEFCAAKHDLKVRREGIDVSARRLNRKLFPFQKDLVRWALATGKAALFCECGLGKTGMQLEWARHVAEHDDGPVLILAPLAVSAQTVREGKKFGIKVEYVTDQSEVSGPISVTNYERLHKFNAATFIGVVLDESSIIKNFTGAVKRQIFEAFANTPRKLACTATPAPNDHMELGQHAEFLDVLTSHEMLARWFINDTQSFGTYRLKGHAARDYWQWVCSWARCVGAPSDLGYSDDGFKLPKLNVRRHQVDAGVVSGDGKLFDLPDLSATAIHREKRRTIEKRAQAVRDIVLAEPDEPWIVWCETDYEEDAVLEVLPGAVSIRGSMDTETKESRLTDFAEGRSTRIATKGQIAGLGLNFQHCARQVFVGATYSFERFYQAIRRSWRFGQRRPVEVHVVMATTEGGVWDVLMRKQEDHRKMQREMFEATRRAIAVTDNEARGYTPTGAWPLAEFVRTA